MRPITRLIVDDLVSLRRTDTMLGLAAATLYALAHDGVLRGGEVTSPLVASDITFANDSDSMELSLARTKTHRKGDSLKQPVAYYKHPNSAVRLMRKWFRQRNLQDHPTAFIFPQVIFVNGTPSKLDNSKHLTYRALVALLRHDLRKLGYDEKKYGGHSFRAGGATDLFLSRSITLAQIMLYGRWKTVEAAMKYFRAELDAAKQAAKVFDHKRYGS